MVLVRPFQTTKSTKSTFDFLSVSSLQLFHMSDHLYNVGSDIDTLCVVPRHVQREHFFSIMHELLSKRPEVTELSVSENWSSTCNLMILIVRLRQAVEEAYVPVIRFQFSGIPIDLVFSKIAAAYVPDSLDLKDNEVLRNLDERCIRGLNGSRVTDGILALVPSIPTFRSSLRVIRMWAKGKSNKQFFIYKAH